VEIGAFLSEDSIKDGSVFISYGLVLSLKYGDVEKVRSWLEENGAKIVYQIVASSPLFVLREYQVRKAIQGDSSELKEVYQRKQRRVEK
jgi:hypothetical protein